MYITSPLFFCIICTLSYLLIVKSTCIERVSTTERARERQREAHGMLCIVCLTILDVTFSAKT